MLRAAPRCPAPSIAIFGTGAVGLAAVMAARIVGADPIIGVDINPARLELALELGATHAIDNRHEAVASRIAAITGGGVDYVLEITGSRKRYQLATEVLNPRGTVAIFTGATGTKSLPGGRKSLGIIEGDAVPQRFIPKLIALYQAGQFPFDRLVKFYAFSEINQAIDGCEAGRDRQAGAAHQRAVRRQQGSGNSLTTCRGVPYGRLEETSTRAPDGKTRRRENR